MLTGSIEKLGALPIVIALYLQFKDFQWPPHASWLEIFLIFALVFGYWLSVTQISVRLRLQLYEHYSARRSLKASPSADGKTGSPRIGHRAYYPVWRPFSPRCTALGF